MRKALGSAFDKSANRERGRLIIRTLGQIRTFGKSLGEYALSDAPIRSVMHVKTGSARRRCSVGPISVDVEIAGYDKCTILPPVPR